MSVHMFRVFVGLDPAQYSASDLETAFSDWVAANAEWVGDSASHSIQQTNTAVDGSGTTYYRGDVLFEKQDTKPNLLQKFTDKVVNKVSWYRIGYHDCTHDEANPQSCSWNDSAEWTAKDVSVPSDVPTFTV